MSPKTIATMNVLKLSGCLVQTCHYITSNYSHIQTQIDVDLLKRKIDHYFGKHQSANKKEERYIFGKECKYTMKMLCDNNY